MQFTAAHLAIGATTPGTPPNTPRIKVPKLVRQHNTLDWYQHLFIHGYTTIKNLVEGKGVITKHSTELEDSENHIGGFLALEDSHITFLKNSHMKAHGKCEREEIEFSTGTLVLWDHRTGYELPAQEVAPVRFTHKQLHALYTKPNTVLTM